MSSDRSKDKSGARSPEQSVESGERKAQRLLQILQLEKIEENLFRGNNELPRSMTPTTQVEDAAATSASSATAAPARPEASRLFGGQVLSQALQAAYSTLGTASSDAVLNFHSLHGYFLRAGTSVLPVLYEVDRIRDGRSFTTRRVVGIQRGSAIFSMSASFQCSETGFEHAHAMPNVPPPEELRDDVLVAQEFAPDDPAVRGFLSPMALQPRAFRTRSVFPIGTEGWREQRRWNPVWLKFCADLPQQQNHHTLRHMLLAYASDMGLVSTALLPLNGHTERQQWQLASLDHALWLHRPDLTDDWLLLHKHTSIAQSSRGLVHAEFFNRDGLLVASVTQEGLMRQTHKA